MQVSGSSRHPAPTVRNSRESSPQLEIVEADPGGARAARSLAPSRTGPARGTTCPRQLAVQASWSIDRHGIFLELFAGAAPISKHLRKRGWGALAFEISNGACFDLTRECVLQTILGWCSSGTVLGVWLSTPCVTWSCAYRNPMVRNAVHIYGIPDLPPKQVQ